MRTPHPLTLCLLVLALGAGPGCVDAITEEGHPCPCESGWRCCASTGTCLREGATCPASPPPRDTLPPDAPVLKSATPGSPTASTTVTLDGNAEPGATVVIYTAPDCTGFPAGTTTADNTGAFRAEALLGTNTTTVFHARATDAAGNASPCSDSSVSVLHDGLSPEPPRLVSVTPSPSRETQPVLTGEAEPGSTVRFFSDAACTAPLPFSARVDDAGTFRLQEAAPLESTTTFYARAVDAVGNASLCSPTSLRYTHDATPPMVPVLSGPAVAGQELAQDATGRTEPGAHVRLFTQAGCAGAPVAEGTADAEGLFSLRFQAPPESTVTLSAHAADAVGNTSACSAPRTFTHDTHAPGTPTQLATVPASPSNATTQPEVRGLAEPGATVRIYLGAQCSAAKSYRGTADATGRFAITVEVPANTSTVLTGTVTDAAGNVSPCSAELSFTHDSLPPAAPVLFTTMNAPSPTTDTERFYLTGTAEPAATLRVYASPTCTGPVLAQSTAHSSTYPVPGFFGAELSALLDTDTTLHVTATDAAGNTSACASPGLEYIHTRGPGWGLQRFPFFVSARDTPLALTPTGEVLQVWDDPDLRTLVVARLPNDGSWNWEIVGHVQEDLPSTTSARTLASDANGNIFVAWTQLLNAELGQTEARVGRFVPGSGWQPVQVLRDSATAHSWAPALATDAAGNAFALWYEREPKALYANLRVSRFTPEGGWGKPLALSPRPTTVEDPATERKHLAVSANGEAWAFWWEYDNGWGTFWSSHFTPATGWGAPERQPRVPVDVRVAADGAGGVVMTWSENQVWTRRFVAGQGWTEPRPLTGVSFYVLSVPEVSVNARGEALAVWMEHHLNNNRFAFVWASRFTPETGWSEPQELERFADHVEGVQAAIDSTGTAFAGWVQSSPGLFPDPVFTGSSSNLVPMVARFEPARGWHPPQVLAKLPSYLCTLRLQTNARGETLATWFQQQTNTLSYPGLYYRQFR